MRYTKCPFIHILFLHAFLKLEKKKQKWNRRTRQPPEEKSHLHDLKTDKDHVRIEKKNNAVTRW